MEVGSNIYILLGSMCCGYSLSEGSEGFGTNTWRAQFDAGYALFNKRYRPTPANGVPVYAPQISVTGLFVNDEPATQKTI